MTPPPLAHPSHWIAGLLYLAPVIILGFAIMWQRLNDRAAGEGAEGGDAPQEKEPPPPSG